MIDKTGLFEVITRETMIRKCSLPYKVGEPPYEVTTSFDCLLFDSIDDILYVLGGNIGETVYIDF